MRVTAARTSLYEAVVNDCWRVLREILQEFPCEAHGASVGCSLYLVLDTSQVMGLPAVVRAQNPKHIVIVLENDYFRLDIRDGGISVDLGFGGVVTTVGIPWTSVLAFRFTDDQGEMLVVSVPQLCADLLPDACVPATPEAGEPVAPEAAAAPEADAPGAQVVSLADRRALGRTTPSSGPQR